PCFSRIPNGSRQVSCDLPIASRNSSAVSSSHLAGSLVCPCAQLTQAIAPSSSPLAQRRIAPSHCNRWILAHGCPPQQCVNFEEWRGRRDSNSRPPP